MIKPDVLFKNWLLQNYSVQSFTSTQSDVNLTLCKGAAPDIDYYMLECLSLTLMNRDRPGKH